MRKDSFLGDGDQRKISREVHLCNLKTKMQHILPIAFKQICGNMTR
jgi:hypothetical protein